MRDGIAALPWPPACVVLLSLPTAACCPPFRPPCSNATVTACSTGQPLELGVAAAYMADALTEFGACATAVAAPDALLTTGCSFSLLADELAAPTCRPECGAFLSGQCCLCGRARLMLLPALATACSCARPSTHVSNARSSSPPLLHRQPWAKTASWSLRSTAPASRAWSPPRTRPPCRRRCERLIVWETELAHWGGAFVRSDDIQLGRASAARRCCQMMIARPSPCT